MDEIVERVRQETGHRYAAELVYCSRSGPPHVPWLEPDVNDRMSSSSQARRAGAWWSCRSASSPTTWRSSTTSTPRQRRPPRSWGSASPAPPPPGSTPGSSRWSATCCVERAAVERGVAGDPARSPSARQPAVVGRLPGRLLRQPARSAAGAVRSGLSVPRRPRRRLLGPRRPGERGPARRPPWSAERRRDGVEVADTKSSPIDVVTEADRAAEDLIRERLPGARGPETGSSARRARRDTSASGDHLGGRPDRRHRQLPLRHPAVRRLDRRASGRRGRRRRGRGRRQGGGFTAARGGGARPRRPAGPGPRPVAPTGRAAGARPASATSATPGWRRPRPCTSCSAEVRDIRRMGSAALDLCCRGLPDAPTPTSRRGSTTGTSPPAGWSPRRPAARRRGARGGRQATAWWPRRPDGFDELLAVVEDCGFLAS